MSTARNVRRNLQREGTVQKMWHKKARVQVRKDGEWGFRPRTAWVDQRPRDAKLGTLLGYCTVQARARETARLIRERGQAL